MSYDQADAVKKRYWRYREAGICGRCGKNPPVQGHSLCAECAEKGRIRMRKLYAERDRLNLCRTCGIPLKETETRKRCFKCRLKISGLWTERKGRNDG